MSDPFREQKVALTAMFEVIAIRGAFLDLRDWEYPDVEIRNVYTNAQVPPPIELGDTFLMSLVLESGLWKVTLCGNKYEEIEIDYEEDEPDWH